MKVSKKVRMLVAGLVLLVALVLPTLAFAATPISLPASFTMDAVLQTAGDGVTIFAPLMLFVLAFIFAPALVGVLMTGSKKAAGHVSKIGRKV